MTNEEMLGVAEIVERATNRLHKQAADHETKMAEHRASFGARTEADAKIIAGLREERNGLLTQVQDQRAEIERLQWENATMHKDAENGYAEAIMVLGDPIALSKERDALRAEVAALQERLRASIARGDLAQLELSGLKAQIASQTPPEASHDTTAGKEAAEAVIRDSRSGEIPMCVGDEVEVIGRSAPASGSGMFTGTIAPIGTRGIAVMIHGTAGFVELDNGTRASICDVRKVPQ